MLSVSSKPKLWFEICKICDPSFLFLEYPLAVSESSVELRIRNRHCLHSHSEDTSTRISSGTVWGENQGARKSRRSMIINSVAQQNGKIQQGMVDMEEELEKEWNTRR
jgi:hypothetical protein